MGRGHRIGYLSWSGCPASALFGQIAELCRREGINQNLYYRWSKELEAGKKRLAGDTARQATSDAVRDLRSEDSQLKEMLAEVLMEN